MAKVELDIRAQITNLNKGLDKTQKELKQLQTQSNRTSKTMQKNINNSSKSLQRMTGHLKTILTIGALVQLTKSMINVRKEFEKFSAMLKVALGSAEAANREFDKLKQFAAETPFSVRELTESFVKLVNQGFQPTIKELTAMGDLAAAMGKDFIQLTEAIIDAQVGEFERLKEFGIRASKEGDKVSLSFKGIEKQVNFTAGEIQQAIIGFGQMEGVMGTMDEISKTLGGRISNLGDAWDGLMDTMGARTSGVSATVITGLTGIITKVQELLELTDAAAKGKARGQGIIKSLIIGEDEDTGELIFDMEALGKELEFFESQLEAFQKAFDAAVTAPALEGLERERLQVIRLRGEELEATKATVETLRALIVVTDEDTGKKKEQLKTIEDISKEIKELNKDLQETKVINIEERIRLEGEIRIRQELIKSILAQKSALEKLVQTQEEEVLGLENWMLTSLNTTENVIGTRLDGAQMIEDLSEQAFKDNRDRLVKEERDRLDAEQLKQDKIGATFDIAAAGLGVLAQLQDTRLKNELAAAGDNEEEKAKIMKEFAKKQQALAIAGSIISGAEWIVRLGQQLGVAAPPFQIAAGLVTLAQIAVISSQKFEKGGYDVLKGRRHAQGGIAIGLGEEAEGGEGRAIFNRQATQKYGKFLPAFVKAINENNLDVTDGGSYAFNYDDSRSVDELKVISALLSKPEVRYENGYRIETRKGQRTKVKV